MNWDNFDKNHTAELIKLYKGGATISDLKKKWHCNGNPLVARLKEAGVYGKAKPAPAVKIKAAVKPKAAKKARKAQTHSPTPENAATATAAPESPAPATVPAAKPVDPLAATTVVDGNGAPVGKASAWTAEEEREIVRYQETEGLSRKSAVQKMRRRQQAATQTPIYA